MADRWQHRRTMAAAIRIGAVVVPIAGSVLVSVLAANALPDPEGFGAAVWWWLVVVGLTLAVLHLLRRLARRVLPLAVLLELSLIFPDRAPSRLRVALRAGTVRHLERQIALEHERGNHDTTQRAAERVVALAAALAVHDRATRGHSERVRALSELIGEEMALTTLEREHLRWAALLHDIGKLSVPTAVLNKRGPLDDSEWDAIRRHPAEGAALVAPLREWLGAWVDVVEQHHERWDGSGYPAGLARQSIGVGARIVAVADAFDVITNPRSYKPVVGPRVARAEMAVCAGHQFDPAVVRAFLDISIGRLRWLLGPIAALAGIPAFAGLERARTQLGGLVSSAGPVASTALAVGIVAAALGPLAPDNGESPGDTTRRDRSEVALPPTVTTEPEASEVPPEEPATATEEPAAPPEFGVSPGTETAAPPLPEPAPIPQTEPGFVAVPPDASVPPVVEPAPDAPPAEPLPPAEPPAAEPPAAEPPAAEPPAEAARGRRKACVGQVVRENAHEGMWDETVASVRGEEPGGGQQIPEFMETTCGG